jgi:hypothetical protein
VRSPSSTFSGNLIAGIIFIAIGLLSLATGDYLPGVIWVALGATMALPETVPAFRGRPWKQLPAWLRYGQLALLALAIIVFLVQLAG